MKLDCHSFARYVEHMKRIDPRFEKMKATLVNGEVVWTRIKSENKSDDNQELKKEKNKKKKTKKSKRKKDFIEIRNLVIERDGYKCSECGMIGNLEVHHIEYRSNGGNDEMDNLITLCSICHYEQHKGEPIANLMISNLRKKGLL